MSRDECEDPTIGAQYDKGLALRRETFGREQVDKRLTAFGAFGEPLQQIINAYAYGDVWQRTGLPMAMKSVVMVGMMAAQGRQMELKVHLTGAVRNGVEPAAIQDVLLLVAMYCGIPAANEAHRIAMEVFAAEGLAV